LRPEKIKIPPRIQLAAMGIKNDGITLNSPQKIAVKIGIKNEVPTMETIKNKIRKTVKVIFSSSG
jgi:hypothetical protein